MITPPPKSTRVSVPVTPEVLAKFQRFSDASGLSLGRSIGEWLKDTASALDAMTEILETHKRAPAEAIVKFQGLAASLQNVADDAIAGMKRPRREGVPPAGEAHAAADAFRRAAPLTPPVGNTGGKVPKKGKKNTKGL